MSGDSSDKENNFESEDAKEPESRTPSIHKHAMLQKALSVKDLLHDLVQKNVKQNRSHQTSNTEEVSELQKDDLRSRTASDQFDNDIRVWKDYLEKGNHDHTTVMKRVFSLISHSGLEVPNVANIDQLEQINQESPMNPYSVLSHGGRLLLELPRLNSEAEDPNGVFNALFGDVLKSRPFASHSLSVIEDHVVEELLVTSAVEGDYATLSLDAAQGRHYGMRLGLSHTGYAPEDGSHGCLYVYYLPPTKSKPGGIMIGVETAEPGMKNPYGQTHDAGAVKGEFTSTGGTKFTSSQFAKYQEVGAITSPTVRERTATSHEIMGGLRITLESNSPQDVERLMQGEPKDRVELKVGSSIDYIPENIMFRAARIASLKMLPRNKSLPQN